MKSTSERLFLIACLQSDACRTFSGSGVGVYGGLETGGLETVPCSSYFHLRQSETYRVAMLAMVHLARLRCVQDDKPEPRPHCQRPPDESSGRARFVEADPARDERDVAVLTSGSLWLFRNGSSSHTFLVRVGSIGASLRRAQVPVRLRLLCLLLRVQVRGVCLEHHVGTWCVVCFRRFDRHDENKRIVNYCMLWHYMTS